MPRRTSGPDHLDAANDYLDAAAKARAEQDWAKLFALAAAAQAHQSMASLAWQVSCAPAAVLSSRAGQRWLSAAAVDQAR